MPHVLSYARPIVARDTNAPDEDLLPLATYCALAPMCLGVATFLLWLLTRWMFFEFLGLWIILLGLILLVLGGICLVMYLVVALLAHQESVTSVLKRVVVIGSLMMLNFPIAWGILLAVRAIGPSFGGI